MRKYTTQQGDAWDMIAKKVYGDEKYTSYLMQGNMKLLDFFIFSSGIVLNVPDLTEEITRTLPEWRK